MKTTEPPVRALTYQERYHKLWTSAGCLKEQVVAVLSSIEMDKWGAQVTQSQKLISDTEATIQLAMDDNTEDLLYKDKYNGVRKVLADISDILRSVNSLHVMIPAFCDILLMYAHTETYFT